MKIYGYAHESDKLMEFSEASIVASASELRELALLLQMAADQKDGSIETNSDHMHFRDFYKELESDSADLIVITG